MMKGSATAAMRAGVPRRVLLALIVITLAVCAFPAAATAQPSYSYQAFHSRFTVNSDGTLLVRHLVTYNFTDPSGWVGITVPSSYGYVEEGRLLDANGEPLPQGTWESERGEEYFTLWFHCADAEPVTTVVYEYTVIGALKVSGDSVELSWTGTPTGRTSPIEESSLTVELPAPVDPAVFRFEVKTERYAGKVEKRLVGDRQAVAELHSLGSEADYEFRCSWPVSIMDLAGRGFLQPGEEVPAEGMKEWEFERFDVDITVEPDASFTVRETQVINFRGDFSFLNRDLSDAGASFEEGRTYGKVRIRDIAVYDLHGDPYDEGLWSVEKLSSGKRVHIDFQASDETMGWVIEYRMTGALIFAPDHARLYWDAVSSDRPVNIKSSRITVSLPPGTDMSAVRTKYYFDLISPPSRHESGREGDLLWWSVEDVDPYSTFTIDVAFPREAVRVPWQYGRACGAAAISASGAFIALVLALMLLLWWRKGRDIGRRGMRVVRYDPPQGLTPAMTDMLVRESTRVPAITATIVDLARRGFLALREEERRGVIRRRVFGFRRLQADTSSLLPYERKLLDSLFIAGDDVTEDDLANAFHIHVKPILDGVRKEVLKNGLFDRDPARIRAAYLAGGFVMCAISAAFLLLLPRWFDLGWFSVAAAAPLPAGILVAAVGWFMPRRTRKGSEAYEHAMGFKEYLVTAEREELESMTPENFERNLPYAMVLGVSEAWLSKFRDIYRTPPSWYEGGGTALGFAAFASSLRSMEGSLGRTLTSTPGSSGSSGSGGGFGGGFSGGGFGGGGSSAG
ncbi:MAG: DUF2207 domain-containing protein [Actinobacteria bacterium]|nr:DUF2207 domain-containing protein [Actinomycetota bacterium]